MLDSKSLVLLYFPTAYARRHSEGRYTLVRALDDHDAGSVLPFVHLTAVHSTPEAAWNTAAAAILALPRCAQCGLHVQELDAAGRCLRCRS